MKDKKCASAGNISMSYISTPFRMNDLKKILAVKDLKKKEIFFRKN